MAGDKGLVIVLYYNPRLCLPHHKKFLYVIFNCRFDYSTVYLYLRPLLAVDAGSAKRDGRLPQRDVGNLSV